MIFQYSPIMCRIIAVNLPLAPRLRGRFFKGRKNNLSFASPSIRCPTLYALPYLAVKSYKVMRRRISIAAAIISAVVLCAAQCAYIMDNNILNSGNAALIEIVLTYLSVNVHISCLSAYKISACGVPQALFAAMSLLFLSFLCPVFLYVACGAVPVQFVCVRQFVRILRQKLPHLFPYLFYGQPA